MVALLILAHGAEGQAVPNHDVWRRAWQRWRSGPVLPECPTPARGGGEIDRVRHP